MKRGFIDIMLIGALISLFYGCGTQGGSSTKENGSGNGNIMAGLSLLNSKQGLSGGFVDVNGDGVADKVVGAPYAIKGDKTGVALVYKGDGSGGYSSSPYLVLTGGDNFGYSFARILKGTNETGEQFAIGAISGSRAGAYDASLTGTVYIYQSGSNGQNPIVLAGESGMDKFGVSIAAGDFNSDGYADIAIGAPFHTPSSALYQQGAVYVYFGPDFSDAGMVALRASNTNKGLGWQVAAGDINGDTYTDLLISATGKVLVYKGVALGSSFQPAIDAPNLTIANSATGFGKSIAVLDDLDIDGYKDIAIGAPNATIGVNRDTGSVYIMKGTTATVTTAIAQMNGTDLFDRFGSSLTVVPDMDSDGKQELVVGATMVNNQPTNVLLSGRVYLFKSTGRSGSTWLPSSSFAGTTGDQSYGYFLASAGGNKLLIGAPRSNIDTGGVSMVDLLTGQVVAGGSSGGGYGDSGDCH